MATLKIGPWEGSQAETTPSPVLDSHELARGLRIGVYFVREAISGGDAYAIADNFQTERHLKRDGLWQEGDSISSLQSFALRAALQASEAFSPERIPESDPTAALQLAVTQLGDHDPAA